MGVQNLILEGDAAPMVQAVNSEAPTFSHFGHVVDDTRQILLSLTSWKCSHVGRTGKNAAHLLAKMAVHHVIDRLYLDNFPDCICDIILKEQHDLFI